MSDDHPRDRFDLIPDAAAETAFLDAWERGRLHHAWLLCGVEGVGKATFAYRAASHAAGASGPGAHGGDARHLGRSTETAGTAR